MLGNFACARYRFVLEATTPLRLNAFAGQRCAGGSATSSAHRLHLAARRLPGLPAQEHLFLPVHFETAPPPTSEKLRNLEQIPGPLSSSPPRRANAFTSRGTALDFRLVLVGRAIAYLPYFVFTFRELGRAGLGPGRGNFDLAEVHVEGLDGGRAIYTAAEGILQDGGERVTVSAMTAQRFGGHSGRLAVHFLTPARIRRRGPSRTSCPFRTSFAPCCGGCRVSVISIATVNWRSISRG